MSASVLSEFPLGDMQATFVVGDQGEVGFCLLPQGTRPDLLSQGVDSAVQVAITGSAASGGFASGHTLRNGATTNALRCQSQDLGDGEGTVLTTTWTSPEGLEVRQRLLHRPGSRAVRVQTVVTNHGPEPVSLDLLSSFSLMGLSSLPPGADERLLVHRIRSVWSAEGRVVTEALEDLQLETSWSRHGVRVERFGQVGSLPVRKWFPFVAVEDPVSGVTWAVQLACASSWQLELYRRTGTVCVSGGLADFEFGHWQKVLNPGEKLESPWAYLTCVRGGLDEASQRLLDLHHDDFRALRTEPVAPQFNEFCTTWGEPSHERIQTLARGLRGRGMRYLVIDAGWYADPQTGWEKSHGDWVVSSSLFPQGLDKTVEAIRVEGLEPGLWFELETCGELSRAYGMADHLLRRGGVPITSGPRRFWDMRDPWVVDYLADRVIGLLKRYGFRYLKIDYNESAGVGCDGAESLGEGLRQIVAATEAFFRRIRQEVPGLVIETCASGGHRLQPSILALSDVASFSDAHECVEIPVIAANLHRVMLPAQSLIWAVLRKDDSLQRIVYSLVNTFLGVPCLSGDAGDLAPGVWAKVEQGLGFYHTVSKILEDGFTRVFGPPQRSYRRLAGWQAVVRTSSSLSQALVVIHGFSGTYPATVAIPVGPGWRVEASFGLDPSVSIEGDEFKVLLHSEFEALAVRLGRV